ncbi:hypothetical protein MMC25_003182 [Agyrium rufum]|nr:hypothetical protein [Agyrium rufum]
MPPRPAVTSIRYLRGRRAFTSSRSLPVDFSHVVVGGGVVGLAIARELADKHPNESTLLIERHGSFGTETSSRNSEVIHAGLYYPVNSLKTNLCLEGREMMYALCKKERINYRNTKKWIVAQNGSQMAELEKLHKKTQDIGVPTHFISSAEAKSREPDVRAEVGALESLTTGIVDSHGLMAWLEGSFIENGGTTVYHTNISEIVHESDGSFTIKTKAKAKDANSVEDESNISASTVINAAGLAAIPLANQLFSEHDQVRPYYAKGTYFSYAHPTPKPLTLIYPAPKPGLGGLGTHLTMDLSNPPRIRFGPDVEWIDDPTDYTPNHSRLAPALDEIQDYLPGLNRDAVEVDYCGIRPKLTAKGEDAADFYIKEESERGLKGLVNLMGIESPGLTSSLAIAKMKNNSSDHTAIQRVVTTRKTCKMSPSDEQKKADLILPPVPKVSSIKPPRNPEEDWRDAETVEDLWDAWAAKQMGEELQQSHASDNEEDLDLPPPDSTNNPVADFWTPHIPNETVHIDSQAEVPPPHPIARTLRIQELSPERMLRRTSICVQSDVSVDYSDVEDGEDEEQEGFEYRYSPGVFGGHRRAGSYASVTASGPLPELEMDEEDGGDGSSDERREPEWSSESEDEEEDHLYEGTETGEEIGEGKEKQLSLDLDEGMEHTIKSDVWLKGGKSRGRSEGRSEGRRKGNGNGKGKEVEQEVDVATEEERASWVRPFHQKIGCDICTSAQAILVTYNTWVLRKYLGDVTIEPLPISTVPMTAKILLNKTNSGDLGDRFLAFLHCP